MSSAVLPDVKIRTSGEYVQLLREINNEIAQAIDACGTEQLWQLTVAEGWTVAATANHAAGVQQFVADLFNAFLDGRTSPAVSAEDIDGNNARQAARTADAGRDDTLAHLDLASAALIAAIEGFPADQFGQQVSDVAGFSMTAEQLLEFAIIGHLQEHLASIRATIAS